MADIDSETYEKVAGSVARNVASLADPEKAEPARTEEFLEAVRETYQVPEDRDNEVIAELRYQARHEEQALLVQYFASTVNQVVRHGDRETLAPLREYVQAGKYRPAAAFLVNAAYATLAEAE